MISEIEQFAKWMQEELEANKNKGNWKDFTSIPNIISELEYHKAKLLLSIKYDNKELKKEYLADTANFLLMLGNALNLYD